MGFEQLEGGRLHSLAGQCGPLLNCAHGEKRHHASLRRAWLRLLYNLPVGTGRSHYVPWNHLFSRLEHPSTPSTSQGKCSSLTRLGTLCWTCSSLSVSFLHGGERAELDGVFQEWSDDLWIRAGDHFPLSAGHAPADKAWDAVVHLCCQGTLLTRAQLAAPRALPARQCPSYAIARVSSFPSTGLCIFVLAEFHKVPVSSSLQPVQVSLDDSPALKHINWSPLIWCHLQMWCQCSPLPPPGHW